MTRRTGRAPVGDDRRGRERVDDPVDDYVDAVLAVVEAIPSGRVMTYGDIAAQVGRGGPRGVGRVMSQWGASVAWWRVVPASGTAPAGHEVEAQRHYDDEETPRRGTGERLDLPRARWAPPENAPATGDDERSG